MYTYYVCTKIESRSTLATLSIWTYKCLDSLTRLLESKMKTKVLPYLTTTYRIVEIESSQKK